MKLRLRFECLSYIYPLNLLSTKQLHPKKSENEDEEKKKEYET